MKAHALPAGIRPDVLVPPGALQLEPLPSQVRMIDEVLGRARDGGFTVWYGRPGGGKTWAAWLVCRIAAERKGSFAAYLDAPRPSGMVWDERKTLRAILGDIGAPLTDRAVRGQSSGHLARHLAIRLLAANIRLLVIDEAGYLGARGLEALGMLSDHMASQAEPFHVLLVGMTDLPGLLRTNPRIDKRVLVHEHIHEVSTTSLRIAVLQRHDWIEGACDDGVSVDELIECAHQLTQGCMRDAIALFARAQEACCTKKIRLNPAVLRYVFRASEEERRDLFKEEAKQAAARSALPELWTPELRRRFANAGVISA